MRLHRRVTAIREFLGSDAFVADSLLLANRFFGCREEKCAISWRTCHVRATILRASMLGTFLMNAPLGMPAVYGLLCLPLHPSQPPYWRQHTPTEGFEASGGGSSKLHKDSPGHCCGRTPTVDESRAKENPQQCVCKSGLPPYGSFEAPTPVLQIHFCLSTGFVHAEKKNLVAFIAGLPERGLRLLYYHVDSLSWSDGDLA